VAAVRSRVLVTLVPVDGTIVDDAASNAIAIFVFNS
jgi:hypothetical protein